MPRHHAHQARVQLPLLAPVGGPLVEDEPVPQQELQQPLPGALQVLARVLERARQVAAGLALLVGHVHLHHVPGGEQPRQELRVAPVGLPPAVDGRLLHPGDRAHGAVQPERPQRAAEVEPRHAGLVDRPGRVERERPLGDGGWVVGERRVRRLPGHRVEGAGCDGPGVYVEADRCGILGHCGPLSSHCGARPRLVVRPLSPDPRSCDR